MRTGPNKNAAATVGITTDALFLNFRGTNDNSGGDITYLAGYGTPDTDHWYAAPLVVGRDEGMADHYALFAPLIAAVEKYLLAHPLLKIVYVSGHSLGASMVQRFMELHNSTLFPGIEFKATMFASPGYELGYSNDPRNVNIWLSGDAILTAAKLQHNSGDENTIYHNLSGSLSSTDIHKMALYDEFAAFLATEGFNHSTLRNLGGIDYDSYFAFRTAGVVGGGNDVITGHGTTADVILGGAGNDILNGGNLGLALPTRDLKADRLYGGTGDDTFVFNENIDVVIEHQSEGNDTIKSSVLSIDLSLSKFANVENVELTGTAALNATGNGVANKLTGNNAANIFIGGGGVDVITTGAGVDRIRFNNVTEGGDKIADFSTVDYFEFLGSAFGMAAGTVINTQFVSRLIDNSAQDIYDRFVFRQSDDTLWYDADGSLTLKSSVLIADLTNDFAMVGSDILII